MGKEIPAPKWVNAFFHSFSQVVLVENNISGLLILAAFFVFSWEAKNWNIGIIVVVAAIIGNVTAKLLGNDDDAIAAGLFGFCPVLVGAAAAVFFAGTEAYIVAIIGSILVIPVTTMINKLCARIGLPGFTMPFIAMTWFFILVSFGTGLLTSTGYLGGVREGAVVVAENGLAANTFASGWEAVSASWLDALTKGIGEIYLMDTVWGSLLIFLAFAIDRWHIAVKIALVICFTLAMGIIFKVDMSTLTIGIYTYNAILVLMGLETFSTNKGEGAFSKSGKYWLLLLLGLVLVGLVDYALPTVLMPFALPSLTFPFVLTTWALLWFEQHWTKA